MLATSTPIKVGSHGRSLCDTKKHAPDPEDDDDESSSLPPKRAKPAADPERVVVFMWNNPETSEDPDFLVVPTRLLSAADAYLVQRYAERKDAPDLADTSDRCPTVFGAHLLFTTLSLIESGHASELTSDAAIWARLRAFVAPRYLPENENESAYDSDQDREDDEPEDRAKFRKAKDRLDAAKIRCVKQFKQRVATVQENGGARAIATGAHSIQNVIVVHLAQLCDSDPP